ncbi:NAC domain-containing protein 82-like isoform X2 [Andrographis paniculata]|uniref:NAC domain-containing protein 82-like isoform X2 n=1 Tax=Andrographis paniculata TaxID=175694 RepID=UPI0021E8E5E4|nr:NAC domain-containing protein 82-like isoform X2 [Andrographis paniculata]
MVRSSLPPGFRFHPTDVELVMYYLKRKILGKKLRFEAIAEVNIYKFFPSDLPEKSCLKSKDLEWYFLCPIEKKYATGARVKRATENGYWKTTGKDRPVRLNEKTVGNIKTLVFHSGHAPKGDRTDWVLHEYRIVDDEVAAAGLQDSYVLCKVFKKSGPGPQNGAQYGAPFNEEEWSDDEDDNTHLQAVPVETNGSLPVSVMLPEGRICPPPTSSFCPGSMSRFPSADRVPSVGFSRAEVPVEETNPELARLLAQLTDEGTLPLNENEIHKIEPNDKGKKPCMDTCGIYDGLGDLDSRFRMTDAGLDFTEILKEGCGCDQAINNSDYIEIDDLLNPLNGSNGVTGTDHSLGINNLLTPLYGSNGVPGMDHSTDFDMFESYNLENVGQLCHGESSHANQLPMIPTDELYNISNFTGAYQMFNYQFHNGSDASQHVSDEQPGVRVESRDWDPARAPIRAAARCWYLCNCGGSPMHTKAEVTHRAGECTNEALLFMMGGVVGQQLVQFIRSLVSFCLVLPAFLDLGKDDVCCFVGYGIIDNLQLISILEPIYVNYLHSFHLSIYFFVV